MLQVLAPLTVRLLATQSHHPRAMSSRKVAVLAARILPQAGAPLVEVQVTSDVGTALNLAVIIGVKRQGVPSLSSARGQPREAQQVDPICVTGSIFVVADTREEKRRPPVLTRRGCWLGPRRRWINNWTQKHANETGAGC